MSADTMTGVMPAMMQTASTGLIRRTARSWAAPLRTPRPSPSLPELTATLYAARQQRASGLRTLFSRLPAGAARWVALATVTVLSVVICAMMPPHDGGRNLMLIATVCLGAAVSSVAGFAFSAICGAVLFHMADSPVQAVQIMITCSIANQASMSWALRRSVIWRDLLPFLIGGIPGVAVGVGVLLTLNRDMYLTGLGLMLLAYGTVMLFRKPRIIGPCPVAYDVACGFLGGITGGSAGFPSSSIMIWCGMKGWDKTRQRAVVQPFILILQLVALPAICLLTRTGGGAGYDITTLLFIPASLFGTAIGLAVFRRLSDSQFGKVTNVMLIISGLSYVL